MRTVIEVRRELFKRQYTTTPPIAITMKLNFKFNLFPIINLTPKVIRQYTLLYSILFPTKNKMIKSNILFKKQGKK